VPFLSGLALGLSMILPIGPQNIFVLNQGIAGGLRRGLVAAMTAGVCDTLLILAGALGMAAVLDRVPWLRGVLLVGGIAFLLFLGIASLRSRVEDESTPAPSSAGGSGSVRPVVLTCVGVSWGNPHAILDTVVILGSAIVAQGASARVPFAAGAVAASWVFFAVLALAGSWLEKRLTARARTWVRRGSGAIMLVFAAVLAREAVLSL
jgi:L-lysine exporter family protein LysE/ArgO